MNRWTILAAAAVLSTASLASAAGPAPASHDAAHEPAASASARKAAYSGVGVVRKVDAAQGKVTLAHEPIASLGWPAMTMAFRVKDGRLLAGLEPGRKVHFAFVQQGPQYVITSIE